MDNFGQDMSRRSMRETPYLRVPLERKVRARINEELVKSNFVFFFRIELNLYLIGQKMNHQAGFLRIITKNQIQQKKYFLGRI